MPSYLRGVTASSAAVTPVKYKYDSTAQTDTFVKVEIFLNGELTNEVSVTPTR